MSEPYVYHVDEAVLAVPPGFIDGSTNGLRWGEGDEMVVLTIQRLPRRSAGETGDTLEVVARRDVESTIAALHASKLEESGWHTVGPHETWRVRLRHLVERRTVYLAQCFVDADEKVLIVSATGQASQRENIDRILEDVVASVRLRA